MKSKIFQKCKEIFKLLRLNQWFKSFSIFFGSGLLIYLNGINIFGIIKLIISFFGVSFLSSSIYILNDLSDIEKDRLHPIKKFRPLASGKISKKKAKFLFVFMFLLSLFMLSYVNFNNLIIGLIMFLNNLIYSFKPFRLKDIPILDIFSAGLNFSLRVSIGWYTLTLMNIYLSVLIFPFFLAGFLLSCKRMGEYFYLRKNREQIRKTFNFYNEKKLNLMINIFIFLNVLSYCVFSILFNKLLLILTPWFFIQILWYKSFLKEKDNVVKNPEKVFLSKKSFTLSGILFCIAWILITIFF